MGYSHFDLCWKDIDEKLMKYIDRYFDIRFGDVSEKEKMPLRGNEKGALQGYLQSFNDKNGKWIERVKFIKNKLIEKYNQRGIKEPRELEGLDVTGVEQLCFVDRIKNPLKALYRLSYFELLHIEEPIASYDEDGNFDRINVSPEMLKSAINLFALTGALANRVAHASAVPEESNEAYADKHQMIAFLLTAVYDYNKSMDEKVECKFAKLPSRSDGHAYPAFTLKLPKPDELGKVSLHFGGSLGTIGLLFDSIPQRIKDDLDYMKVLNEGFVGDVKCPNIPRNTSDA